MKESGKYDIFNIALKLSDTILNKIIIAPEEKVYYPTTFYATILFLECIIGIILFFM